MQTLKYYKNETQLGILEGQVDEWVEDPRNIQ